MKVVIDELVFDLSNPIDISIPLNGSDKQVNAFHIQKAEMKPYQSGSFIGSVKLGGSANCFDVKMNPHGNGTHTECVGHISKEHHSVNQCLDEFFMKAQLISIDPEWLDGDRIITQQQIASKIKGNPVALVIRTLPNDSEKCSFNYSGSNPAYFEAKALSYLRDKGIRHLLTDLPSVDREEDQGALAAHHAFWNYPDDPQLNMTITEFIYVPDEVRDDIYLLNLQVAPIELDASPSRPLLFEKEKEDH